MIDRYTKIVLTIIAASPVALAYVAVSPKEPLIVSNPAFHPILVQIKQN